MNEVSGSPSEPDLANTAGALAGEGTTAVPVPGTSSAPRVGVPAWRVGKPDAFLAADVTTARAAVRTIANDSDIGKHIGARSEGVRCVSHLFESTKPGYHGWVWFATLARVSRGKTSTVNEVGLLPTDDAVLAPAWLPWAERVRPEDAEESPEPAAAPADGGPHDGGSPATDADEPHASDAPAESAESSADAAPVAGGENL